MARPRPAAPLCVLIDDLNVVAVIHGAVPEHTQYRLVGRDTADVLKNKTLTSTTNNISANNITSDGAVYRISGTPTIGSVLTLSAPNTLTWGGGGSGAVDSNLFTLRATVAPSPATSITSAASADRNIVFPDGSGSVILDSQAQTLSNKLFIDSSTFIVDAADQTKRIGFEAGGTAGTTTTLAAAQTANVTVTLPASTDTLIGRNTTDTLTGKTINSAANTLTVTSAPLSATNINLLINQDVRTTASPTHSTLTLTNGLYLPTSGGTPALFNAYEVYQGTITWSGIWASPITANVTYIRVGNQIHVAFQRAYATATIPSQIVSDPIPARFRPTLAGSNFLAFPAYAILGISGGLGITSYIYYAVAGTRWQVAENAVKAASGTGWTGTGVSGIAETGFTYWI